MKEFVLLFRKTDLDDSSFTPENMNDLVKK